MTLIELLKERHLMDCFFSSQLILMSWHLEHNSKAAQELASLDSVQLPTFMFWSQNFPLRPLRLSAIYMYLHVV